VQGVIWNIFSFDQWGVELGNSWQILYWRDTEEVKSHDSSTEFLLKYF
jgi:glucose-6-phosphate isomerase